MDLNKPGPSNRATVTSIEDVTEVDDLEALMSTLYVTPGLDTESQSAEMKTGPMLLTPVLIEHGLIRMMIVPPRDMEDYCFPQKGAFLKIKVRGEKNGQTIFEEQHVEFFLGDGPLFGLPIGIDVGLTCFRVGETSCLMIENPILLQPIFREPDFDLYSYYVELIEIENLPQYPEEYPLHKRLNLCDRLLFAANLLFKGKMDSLSRAAAKYDLIVKYIQDSAISLNSIPDEVNVRRKLLLYNSHLGLAKCFWAHKLAEIMDEPNIHFAMEQLPGGDDPVKYAKQALELFPNSFDALIILADVHMYRRKPKEALDYYHKIGQHNWGHQKISLKVEECRRMIQEQEMEDAAFARRIFQEQLGR